MRQSQNKKSRGPECGRERLWANERFRLYHSKAMRFVRKRNNLVSALKNLCCRMSDAGNWECDIKSCNTLFACHRRKIDGSGFGKFQSFLNKCSEFFLFAARFKSVGR